MNVSPQPASNSSFYAGMRILPQPRREAMYRIYDFCRAVDDIADGDALCEDPHAALRQWREAIDAVCRGGKDPLADFLKDDIRTYDLKREDFLAVIDGMEMDLNGPIVAPDIPTLDLYCDRVASAVGRLSTPIFGLDDSMGPPLAHHLGRALQLTNILRDLDEDSSRGRLYLAKEDLLGAGISAVTPTEVLQSPLLPEAVKPMIFRAKNHFFEANAIMARAPATHIRAPKLMAFGYEDVLSRIAKRGFSPPRRRVKLRKGRLVLAALVWSFF